MKSVPQSDSSYQTFAKAVVEWQARLTAGLDQSIRASHETLGYLEEQILRQTQGLERKLLQEAAQKKADQTPPVCPVCGRHKLSRCTHEHARTFHTRRDDEAHPASPTDFLDGSWIAVINQRTSGLVVVASAPRRRKWRI